MNEIIKVSYNGEMVLTTEQLAQAYECDVKRISENFKRNEERFSKGKHYFKLDGDALKEFKTANPQIADNLKFAPVIMLWTRRGASRHSKMLGTDKAWEMFDMLEDTYFTTRVKSLDSYMIDDPIERATKWIEEEKERIALRKDNGLLKTTLNSKIEEIEEMTPKANYTDIVLKSVDAVTITQIAKDYAMTAQELNSKLKGLHIQYKQSG